LRSYFISDLHLSPQRPDLNQLFSAFLKALESLGDIRSLYILGDWFATWTGADTQSKFFEETIQALKPLQAQGAEIYFMPGNRDFLLRATDLEPHNIHYLSDPSLINLSSKRLLLLHGDSLCDLDQGYVLYRKIVRNPIVQYLFLKLPAFIRLNIAKKLRSNSEHQYKSRTKPADFYDVSPTSVTAAFSQYTADLMIHGHVHKAAFYNTRMVLGDWGATGSAIEFNKETNNFSLLNFTADSGFSKIV
jgi:UDP-2,3-diacylglucosamine hydrolase